MIKNFEKFLTEQTLKSGSHGTSDEGLCAMEMVAYIAEEPHSDMPKCTCRALRRFVMNLNDRFKDDERQLLKPYLIRLIGTNDDQTLNRGKFLAHAALTVFAPMALEAKGFTEHAEKLRNCKFGEWETNRKIAYAAATAAYATAAYADAAADAANAADAADAAYAANAATAAYAADAADAADAANAADAADAAYAANAATAAYATAAYADAAADARKKVVQATIDVLAKCLEKFPAKEQVAS